MKPVTTRAACLQLTPGNNLIENLQTIAGLVDDAASAGASLIALPEFATYLDRSSASMRSSASKESTSKVLNQLTALAREQGVWLLVGSLVILADDNADEKLSNRS